jgi:hypothetical protein
MKEICHPFLRSGQFHNGIRYQGIITSALQLMARYFMDVYFLPSTFFILFLPFIIPCGKKVKTKPCIL